MAVMATRVLQIAGSDGGIIRDLRYGDPVLLDKLTAFQRLLERNSVPFYAFFERKETDYGRKIGLAGIWKELVCVQCLSLRLTEKLTLPPGCGRRICRRLGTSQVPFEY